LLVENSSNGDSHCFWKEIGNMRTLWALTTNIVTAHKIFFIVWSLIENIYISLIAHKGFVWVLMRDFFAQLFKFLVINCWWKTVIGIPIASGKKLETWEPYERSQQILWPLIRHLFHCVIAHREYLYQFDRS
jgi:hypothetical protein